MNRILDLAFKVEDLRRQATSKRYRIWEVPGTVQCSIVGTCLDRRDVAALLRKGQVASSPGPPTTRSTAISYRRPASRVRWAN